MLHSCASDISEVDGLVSTSIRSITISCLNLRTFTVHLLNFFNNEALHRHLIADSQTALEVLSVTNRLEFMYQLRQI